MFVNAVSVTFITPARLNCPAFLKDMLTVFNT